MKNGKGKPFRWHNVYAVEVWRCQWGKGRPKIHERWPHDPRAGSNWAFDERLSGIKVVASAEAGDCWRRSQVRGRSWVGPKALDMEKIWVRNAHHSLHLESPSLFPLWPSSFSHHSIITQRPPPSRKPSLTTRAKEPSSGHLLPPRLPGHGTSSTTC